MFSLISSEINKKMKTLIYNSQFYVLLFRQVAVDHAEPRITLLLRSRLQSLLRFIG